MGLRSLDFWDCVFESRMILCLVRVACCKVKVSANGPSLIQESPTMCRVSDYDRGTNEEAVSPLQLWKQEEKNSTSSFINYSKYIRD